MTETNDAKRRAEMFQRELTHTSDRHAAIVGCAMIEESLVHAIRHKFVLQDNGKAGSVIDDMFNGYGPVATLRGKRDLGYAVGLFGRTTWLDIEKLGKIRNLFAHEVRARDDNGGATILTFDAKNIAVLCDNLALCDETVFDHMELQKPQNRRDRYINTVMIIRVGLIVGTIKQGYRLQRNSELP